MTQPAKTTVAAIVADKDRSGGTRVLLTVRNIGPFEGQWCLPGGHIKPGQTWVEAVHDEVLEETGLNFKGRFFGSFDEVFPDLKINASVKVYEGCGVGELLTKPTEEVSELRWFPLEQALALSLAFRHNSILKAYAARTLPDGRREELLAEHEALRSEILQRIGLRSQSLHWSITVFGLLAAAAVGDLILPIALMFYPLLALFMAVAWTHNDVRVYQIGTYVRESIEQQLIGLNWEHFLVKQYSTVPHPVYRRFTELSGFGVLLGTSIAAMVLAILFEAMVAPEERPLSVPQMRVAYGILFALDVLAMCAVYWLVRLRRK